MNIDKNWWESQPKWQHNIIQANGSAKRDRFTAWLFFLLLLAVSSYILYDSYEELLAHFYAGEYREMKELVVLFFPAVFFIVQLKKSLKRKQFGSTPLVMNPFPAIIGDTFSAYVEINKQVESLQFSAELLLVQNIDREHYDSRRSRLGNTNMVWKMPVELQNERAMLGTRLLLRAQLPADKPPSESPQVDNFHSWKVYIYSQDKSFKRTWDIPIIGANDYL